MYCCGPYRKKATLLTCHTKTRFLKALEPQTQIDNQNNSSSCFYVLLFNAYLDNMYWDGVAMMYNAELSYSQFSISAIAKVFDVR